MVISLASMRQAWAQARDNTFGFKQHCCQQPRLSCCGKLRAKFPWVKGKRQRCARSFCGAWHKDRAGEEDIFKMEDQTNNIEPRQRRYRILVVDDEPIVCDSIRMLLAFDGHSVQTAGSAEEALERFDPSAVDLLITDYAMPGLLGTALAASIRQAVPDLPVIMVTAHAEMLQAWGADLSNVDRVVSKPFRLGDLRQALAEVVEDVALS